MAQGSSAAPIITGFGNSGVAPFGGSITFKILGPNIPNNTNVVLLAADINNQSQLWSNIRRLLPAGHPVTINLLIQALPNFKTVQWNNVPCNVATTVECLATLNGVKISVMGEVSSPAPSQAEIQMKFNELLHIGKQLQSMF